jgi:hypothetical protein
VSFLLLNERLLFFLLNPCCKGNRHVIFNVKPETTLTRHFTLSHEKAVK